MIEDRQGEVGKEEDMQVSSAIESVLYENTGILTGVWD